MEVRRRGEEESGIEEEEIRGEGEHDTKRERGKRIQWPLHKYRGWSPITALRPLLTRKLGASRSMITVVRSSLTLLSRPASAPALSAERTCALGPGGPHLHDNRQIEKRGWIRDSIVRPGYDD
ncbi:hypothetical protein J6590_002641 [Homalodisca vitripennis]|nr:hypothetical protein J6590_002641 [Homalodisca vitripennis]